MKYWIFLIMSQMFSASVFTQTITSERLTAKKRPSQKIASPTLMPYNRLIESAGKVISYGDPLLENHTLDLCVLPGKKGIAIEDRYGIAIVDIKTNQLSHRWSFSQEKAWEDYISTYSGITSFEHNNKTFISWGAAAKNNDMSAVMIAEWDGKKIRNVGAITFEKLPPAEKALPNQIISNEENGILYLYAVLNGNNQLVKIRFDDRKIMWSAPTGVAPYGVCIIGNKAYVTNWASPLVIDTLPEHAGTPWGSAYTDPRTGATKQGNLSIIDITTGIEKNQVLLGLHPTAIISSSDGRLLYVANGNSDYVSVVDVTKELVIDSIGTGLFAKQDRLFGSSPGALLLDSTTSTLYVTNGMDNAVAVIRLGKNVALKGKGTTVVKGFIPTEAYPSGIVHAGSNLYVTNLEAKGARVLADSRIFQPGGKSIRAFSIHQALGSFSIIRVPDDRQLISYTEKVKKLNLFYRAALANLAPRKGIAARPLPERIGEPSLFKHVVYIIKENKTYDQVFGDIPRGRGDKNLCIYGEKITPNQHKLAMDFSLLDNYYASGKSSAEGHQWTDAAMVSDYVERNVRAWFRSYPHRQEDALVYNKNGFIWNNALDHGKTVRLYGEACLTHYDTKMKWSDIYNKYVNHEPLSFNNTSTIARVRPVISPDYPDCDNIVFTDQIRADVFIKEWKGFEQQDGDQLPHLLVLSLPNDHTAGTSENYPVPRSMVADNDLALGRVIETITNSRFWDSTVVLVTEDDSQSGWDHISSYRTICQVISPYSVFAKTIHTNYNQTSMVRTIEQILGIPPMNVIDATASPMYDCFTDKKQAYSYKFIPNNVPLNDMNKPVALLKGKAKYFARLSAENAFKEVDGGNDNLMNKILWFDAKGDQLYPARNK